MGGIGLISTNGSPGEAKSQELVTSTHDHSTTSTTPDLAKLAIKASENYSPSDSVRAKASRAKAPKTKASQTTTTRTIAMRISATEHKSLQTPTPASSSKYGAFHIPHTRAKANSIQAATSTVDTIMAALADDQLNTAITKPSESQDELHSCETSINPPKIDITGSSEFPKDGSGREPIRIRSKSSGTDDASLLNNTPTTTPDKKTTGGVSLWKATTAAVPDSPPVAPTVSPVTPATGAVGAVTRKRSRALMSQAGDASFPPQKKTRIGVADADRMIHAASTTPPTNGTKAVKSNRNPVTPMAKRNILKKGQHSKRDFTIEFFVHNAKKWPTIVPKGGVNPDGLWVDLKCLECKGNSVRDKNGIRFLRGPSALVAHMRGAHGSNITEEVLVLCHTENRLTTEQVFHLNTGGPLAPKIEQVLTENFVDGWQGGKTGGA